jgi:hypothetical protein
MVCYDILNLCVNADSNYINEKIKMQLKFVALKKFLKVVIALRAFQIN